MSFTILKNSVVFIDKVKLKCDIKINNNSKTNNIENLYISFKLLKEREINFLNNLGNKPALTINYNLNKDMKIYNLSISEVRYTNNSADWNCIAF